MSTGGIVTADHEDWAFFAGLFDGVSGEPPESTSSESYCLPTGSEKLTRGQQLYLWALYIKGYEAGQTLSQFRTETLRDLLRNRVRSYLGWWGNEEDVETVVNLVRGSSEGSSTDQTREQEDREYLLEMLSERESVFMDEVDLILDRLY